MISITSKTGSSDGVIFEESKDSKFKKIRPRVVKSQTLDGAVVYDHRGAPTADREFNVKARDLTTAQVILLQTLVENETYVNLACNEGFFEGIIPRVDGLDVGILDMDFWVYVPIEEVSGNTKRVFDHENITITESVSASVA